MKYKVNVIGIGPGTQEYLLPIAKERIENADILIGAKRLLKLFRSLKKEKITIEGHFEQAVSFIKKYADKKRIALLVSGDPGIYSLLEMLSKKLERSDYEVIPGISSIQLAFARIGEAWRDAKIISLHGRKVNNLTAQIKDYAKVFLLTDRNFPPDKIAKHLLSEGIENRIAVILENLSYPDERIIKTDLKRLSRMNGWGLCSMIIKKDVKKQNKGKLFGVGIGPGDPKLVTLKAKEVLDNADIIFVPKGSEDGSSWALSIVESVVSKEKDFRELTFPMTTDKSILDKYWMRAASAISKEVKNGKVVAFVTIGDPFIYSTYVYLLMTLRKNFTGIDVETIPGISAFNAASSRAQFSLVKGYERLAVVPVTRDLRKLKETLLEFDTIVLMKVGSKLDTIIPLLKELGLIKKAVLISRVGHKDEKIIYNLTKLRDKEVGYLSVILVKKDWEK